MLTVDNGGHHFWAAQSVFQKMLFEECSFWESVKECEFCGFKERKREDVGERTQIVVTKEDVEKIHCQIDAWQKLFKEEKR